MDLVIYIIDIIINYKRPQNSVFVGATHAWDGCIKFRLDILSKLLVIIFIGITKI